MVRNKNLFWRIKISIVCVKLYMNVFCLKANARMFAEKNYNGQLMKKIDDDWELFNSNFKNIYSNKFDGEEYLELDVINIKKCIDNFKLLAYLYPSRLKEICPDVKEKRLHKMSTSVEENYKKAKERFKKYFDIDITDIKDNETIYDITVTGDIVEINTDLERKNDF